jgi:Lecithin retinol acyltransferase
MSSATGSQDFFVALPSEWGTRGFAQSTKSEHATHARIHRIERPLDAESELPMGSHIVTRRHGYTHHGIYAGAGKVVHYAGLSRGLRRGPVEENSLSSFAAGYPVSVVSGVPPKFEGLEVARRARSRIGEDDYRLLTNNCEHFCEWCLHGQHRSYQIDACLTMHLQALHTIRRLIAELLSLAGLKVQTRSEAPLSDSENSAHWTEGQTLERSRPPHGNASCTGD